MFSFLIKLIIVLQIAHAQYYKYLRLQLSFSCGIVEKLVSDILQSSESPRREKCFYSARCPLHSTIMMYHGCSGWFLSPWLETRLTGSLAKILETRLTGSLEFWLKTRPSYFIIALLFMILKDPAIVLFLKDPAIDIIVLKDLAIILFLKDPAGYRYLVLKDPAIVLFLKDPAIDIIVFKDPAIVLFLKDPAIVLKDPAIDIIVFKDPAIVLFLKDPAIVLKDPAIVFKDPAIDSIVLKDPVIVLKDPAIDIIVLKDPPPPWWRQRGQRKISKYYISIYKLYICMILSHNFANIKIKIEQKMKN